MKLIMALIISTSSLSAFAVQNAAKDKDCCQICETEEARQCRGMAQKRLANEKRSGLFQGKGNKKKGGKGAGASQS
jgi:hypothetical protein